ncbi:hypothetical protein [Aeromonas jandaei]|uniref:hypothetical protein n=1 Tax=Aeromonas jandaei TaxID=650 RepID=UPI003F67DC07
MQIIQACWQRIHFSLHKYLFLLFYKHYLAEQKYGSHGIFSPLQRCNGNIIQRFCMGPVKRLSGYPVARRCKGLTASALCHEFSAAPSRVNGLVQTPFTPACQDRPPALTPVSRLVAVSAPRYFCTSEMVFLFFVTQMKQFEPAIGRTTLCCCGRLPLRFCP